MKGSLGKLWLTCVHVLTLPASADVFDALTWRNPLPQGNVLWDVVTHKQGYVAVGVRGSVVASIDGTNWVARKSNTTRHFTAVASDGNLLVGVGQGGSISADDGFTWEDIPGTSFSGLIAYGQNVFVASGNEGALLASRNGRIWTQTYVFSNFFYRVSLAFGNGRFVAVNAGGKVAVSANGYDWSSGMAPNFTSIDFGDGVFVATDVNSAGNGIWTSPDGLTWTKRHAMPPSGPAVLIHAATSLHGRLIAVGRYIVANDGGTNWTTQNLPQSEFHWLEKTLLRVRHGHGRAVAIGSKGNIVTSEDGIHWTSRYLGTDYPLSRIVYGNGRFVITGQGQSNLVMVSTDGERWTFHPYAFDRVEGLAFGNGLFVTTGTGNRPIASSTNGMDWTPAYASIGEWPGAWASVRYITFASPIFLALGMRVTPAFLTEHITLVSSNAQTWQVFATPEIERKVACTYGRGKFVAVGEAGAIATSSDGSSWQSAVSPVTNTLASVAFGAGSFVAVGDSGNVLSSEDGLVWEEQSVDIKPNYTHVTYGGGYFVAVGATNSAVSVISASKNGIHWNHYPTPAYGSRLTQCAYGKGSFVFAGEWGNVLQSGPIAPELTIQLAADFRTVTLTLKGIAGERYQVDGITLLAQDQWQQVGTFTLSNDVLNVEQPVSSDQKYFRALRLAP